MQHPRATMYVLMGNQMVFKASLAFLSAQSIHILKPAIRQALPRSRSYPSYIPIGRSGFLPDIKMIRSSAIMSVAVLACLIVAPVSIHMHNLVAGCTPDLGCHSHTLCARLMQPFLSLKYALTAGMIVMQHLACIFAESGSKPAKMQLALHNFDLRLATSHCC